MVETERILNCIPSKKTSLDWTYSDGCEAGFLERLEPSPTQAQLEKTEPAPYDSDLRRDWWLIGDQEKTGSCVGWACESVLRYHFIKTGYQCEYADRSFSIKHLWLAAKGINRSVDLAAVFIEKSATQIKAALDSARKYGVVTESDLPFTNHHFAEGIQSFYLKAANQRLRAYINLGHDPWVWIQWLKKRGPIIVRIDVNDSWLKIQPDGNLDRHNRPYHGGHATAIVGYKEGRFIFRNSWGTQWGDQGFAYASMQYAMSAVTEAYGILGVCFS